MPYAIVLKGKYRCRVLCTFIAGNPALFIAVSNFGKTTCSLGYAVRFFTAANLTNTLIEAQDSKSLRSWKNS